MAPPSTITEARNLGLVLGFCLSFHLILNYSSSISSPHCYRVVHPPASAPGLLSLPQRSSRFILHSYQNIHSETQIWPTIPAYSSSVPPLPLGMKSRLRHPAPGVLCLLMHAAWCSSAVLPKLFPPPVMPLHLLCEDCSTGYPCSTPCPPLVELVYVLTLADSQEPSKYYMDFTSRNSQLPCEVGTTIPHLADEEVKARGG